MKRFWHAFIAMVTLVSLLLVGPTTVLAGEHEIYYSYALRENVKVYEKKDESSKVIATLAYMEPVEQLDAGYIKSGEEWIEVKLLDGKRPKGYVKIEDASYRVDIAVYYPTEVYLDKNFEKPIGEIGPGEPVVIINSRNKDEEDIWIVATKDVIGLVKPMERYVDYDELPEVRRYASDKPKYITNKETQVKFVDSGEAPYVATLPKGTKVVVVTGRKDVFKICFNYGEFPMFGFVVSANLDRIKRR